MRTIGLAIDTFMHATAWPMERPAAYGLFHLSFTFIGLALVIFLAWRLRNLKSKGQRALLFACGVFLLVCEVYKQLFHYYFINDHAYAWWIFPFYLCSVPMYLCLIAPWLKAGKLQRALYTFMMLYNLLGGAMAFIEPSGILNSYWVVTMHSCVWHMLLIFIGLFLFFSKLGGVDKESFGLSTKTFLVLCVIAFCSNVALRDVSGGLVNNFFVGPSVSSLAVFKQIGEHFGWYVGTALYIPAVILGAFLICLGLRLLARRTEKVKV